MSELLTNSPVFYSLALTLLHFLWQGGLIALLLKAVLSVINYDKPIYRYAMASVATLANLLVPIVTFVIIYLPIMHDNLAVHHPDLLTDLNLPTPLNNEQRDFADWLEWLPYLSFAWLLCVIYLCAKLIIQLHFVKQLPKMHVVAPSEQLMLRFQALVATLKLNSKPQLLISLSAKVPMAIGWLKPVVLIPASMVTGLTLAQLEMLLLHELAHVRRHDYLVNLLQTLVEILLFFHPAVAWVSNQMRNEREYCSDDVAVHHCGDAVAYAHTLTDTATLCQQHKHRNDAIPSMAMAASGGDLKKRVIRLVNHHCTQHQPANKWLAAVVILLFVMTITGQHLLTISLLNEQAGIIPFTQQFNGSTDDSMSAAVTDDTFTPSTMAQQLLTDDYSNPTTIEANFQAIAPAMKEDNLTPIPVLKPRQKPHTQSTKTAVTHTQQQSMLTKHVQPHQMVDELQSNENDQASSDASQTTSSLSKPTVQNNISRPSRSIAEIAFERTDSTRKNSLFTDKYSDQLHALAEDPKAAQLNQSSASFQHSQQSQQPKIVDAKLLNAIEPRYPFLAKRKGIELEVTVHFIITKQGRVRDIEFEQQSKLHYFKRTIDSAVKQWRFVPAKQNGQPVESRMTKIFSFSIAS